jgi:hypothetical protein
MDIENELENACNQGDSHPPREDSATPVDRQPAENANNNNNNTASRTKKMKLETGNERQIIRKRSRSRTAPHKKDKI